MIDFFVDKDISIKEIYLLLGDLFDVQIDDILICSMADLEKIDVGDHIRCLCVLYSMNGCVKLLLQIYRVEIKNFDNFVDNVLEKSKNYEFSILTPFGNFNDFYKLYQGSLTRLLLDEDKSNDDQLFFKLMLK